MEGFKLDITIILTCLIMLFVIFIIMIMILVTIIIILVLNSSVIFPLIHVNHVTKQHGNGQTSSVKRCMQLSAILS